MWIGTSVANCPLHENPNHIYIDRSTSMFLFIYDLRRIADELTFHKDDAIQNGRAFTRRSI